jgi:protein tyrosine phosphatase (PTP) superfamily phosphohydrolase (DUF442 family)
MRLQRYFLGLLTIALAGVAFGSETDDGNPVAGGTDFSEKGTMIGDRTYVTGLIDLEALAAAHGSDVMIVDFRTPEEGVAEEAAAAAALGMAHHNLPVSSPEVDAAQVDALGTLLNSVGPDTQVVLHCVSGNRAAMLWGAWALTEGAELSDVHSEVEGVLTSQRLIDGLDAYAGSMSQK